MGVGTEWTPLMGGRSATFYPVFSGGAVFTLGVRKSLGTSRAKR